MSTRAPLLKQEDVELEEEDEDEPELEVEESLYVSSTLAFIEETARARRREEGIRESALKRALTALQNITTTKLFISPSSQSSLPIYSLPLSLSHSLHERPRP